MVTPSLALNVEHHTIWTHLPAFERSSSVRTLIIDDTLIMNNICTEILEDIPLAPASDSPRKVIAIAIQSESKAGSMHIRGVQLRTEQLNVVLKV
jgi:hypothetical protein